MDLILTICDSAAGETCPFWPGQPLTAHWGLPDPAAVTGDAGAVRRAFAMTYRALERRIEAFLALPLDHLSLPDLQRALAAIGQMDSPGRAA